MSHDATGKFKWNDVRISDVKFVDIFLNGKICSDLRSKSSRILLYSSLDPIWKSDLLTDYCMNPFVPLWLDWKEVSW